MCSYFKVLTSKFATFMLPDLGPAVTSDIGKVESLVANMWARQESAPTDKNGLQCKVSRVNRQKLNQRLEKVKTNWDSLLCPC